MCSLCTLQLCMLKFYPVFNSLPPIIAMWKWKWEWKTIYYYWSAVIQTEGNFGITRFYNKDNKQIIYKRKKIEYKRHTGTCSILDGCTWDWDMSASSRSPMLQLKKVQNANYCFCVSFGQQSYESVVTVIAHLWIKILLHTYIHD